MSSIVHSPLRVRGPGEGWVVRAVDLLLALRERDRQRRHLAALPDYLIKDMGLTRADVVEETSKPVWRA